MPAISMFYGIIVLMFFRDNKQHHSSHIHVRYQGRSAVFAICDGQLLDGSLPQKQTRLVQAWIEIHKDELEANWELAINGEDLFKIAPLQ